jgi:glycosyltransferase involved in cell wall biosynthesis
MLDLVSIIMPAFNSARHISEAIDSVVAQSYPSWELLVVDDCSRDTTPDIVKGYSRADQRIKLVSLDRNSGPAEARNAGIKLAQGRYVAFLDSDDLWFERKLEIQLRELQARGAAFCYSSYVIRKDGDNRERAYDVPPSVTYREMLRGSVIGCSTVIYDTTIVGKRFFQSGDDVLTKSWYRHFIDGIGHEDYALWLSILRDIESRKGIGVVGIAEPLAIYRVRNTSFSSRKLKAALFQWIIYRKYEQIGIVKSILNFIHYGVKGVLKRFGRAP